MDEKSCGEYGERALSSDEVKRFMAEVPDWRLKDKAIERELRFKGFVEAMEFVNRVAALSEAEAHHPDILVSYNRVVLTLSTHKVGGLSCKDFLLATKIDRLS